MCLHCDTIIQVYTVPNGAIAVQNSVPTDWDDDDNFTSWSEDHNSNIALPMSDDEYQFDNQVDDGDIASPPYNPLSSLRSNLLTMKCVSYMEYW